MPRVFSDSGIFITFRAVNNAKSSASTAAPGTIRIAYSIFISPSAGARRDALPAFYDNTECAARQ